MVTVRRLGALALALSASIAACGGGDDGGSGSGSPDASSPPPVDAAVETDAAADAGSGEAACVPSPGDAGSLVDGAIVGMPAADIAVSAPVVTPQIAVTPPAAHFPKQVGVLALSPAVGDVQAVAHLLAPMGIPYAVTTSPVLAVQHDMAIFFPEANAGSFDATALDLLNQQVSSGSVVVMKVSDPPALRTLSGITSSTFQLEHHFVDLTDEGKARFPSLDRPEEQHIPLGGDAATFLNTWALEVDGAASGVTVLATFDDGKPAILERVVGAGKVYTFGIDFRDVVIRNQLGRSLDAARGYINVFEPATDTWMLMIRDIYDASVRFGTRLATAPDGKRAALLLSHDLDWGPSYTTALTYADDEREAGAEATYFAHTKVVNDYQDVAFFTGDKAPVLAALLERGGRVGSHTVAHSPVLSGFPLGTGTETHPTYQPRNLSLTETEGGTLFGELRVSKSLIDGALSTQCVAHEVRAFRAGNLSYHPELPQTLERLGYRFDSTRPIGLVLSNFPYRAMTDWPDALDTSVFEMPVTIEDQKAPRFDERVASSIDIVSANADNGAPTTVLLHPNVLDFKRNGQKALLAGLPTGVMVTSIDTYGAFWRARDGVRLTKVEYDDTAKTLTLALTATEPVKGLTVRVSDEVTKVVSPATATLTAAGGEKLVVLPPLGPGPATTVVLGY